MTDEQQPNPAGGASTTSPSCAPTWTRPCGSTSACSARASSPPSARPTSGTTSSRSASGTRSPSSSTATCRSSTSPSRPASRATQATQFDHLSFDLVDEEALLDLRSRLKAAGCEVTDVVDHGFIRSIYFNDPNGIALEASYWVVDPTGWAEVSLEDERLFGDRNPVRRGRRDPQHRSRRPRPAHPLVDALHQRHRGLGRRARLNRVELASVDGPRHVVVGEVASARSSSVTAISSQPAPEALVRADDERIRRQVDRGHAGEHPADGPQRR